MRSAIVHDWLTGMRGGEAVLEALCEMLPQSDLYTMVYVPGSTSRAIEGRTVHTSLLNRLPAVARYYRLLLPAMPLAAGRMTLRGYDLVVASSHCVAHGVNVPPSTRFVCYCHTPMRYAWEGREAYFPGRKRLDPRYWVLRLLGDYLRNWDRRASRSVTQYFANSRNVQERIGRCYGRDSVVMYPPVDTDFYRPLGQPPGDFYLWVGALAPYKRIDLALEAFRGLDRPLVVIGHGQQYGRARRSASRNVRFLGRQPRSVLRRYYGTCRALIFPGEEDFGIVPVEAQACGRPVVAYGRGGALETVAGIDSVRGREAPTGVFFHAPTAQALREAVVRFERAEREFDPRATRANALRFSRERFKAAMTEYLVA